MICFSCLIIVYSFRILFVHADLKTTLIHAHLSQDYKKRAVDNLCYQMDTVWMPEQEGGSLIPESSLVTA